MKTQIIQSQQEPLETNSEAFIQQLLQQHLQKTNCPSTKEVAQFLDQLLATLFPAYGSKNIRSIEGIQLELNEVENNLRTCLSKCELPKDTVATDLSRQFIHSLPTLYAKVIKDAEAIESGDPAASGIDEVMRSYPGFLAIASYRIAHQLLQLNIQMIPRILTEIAHSRTGIDIHPGAVIGDYFFIDHGTGVVIGETTVIGSHVKLYQGVTLGALSVDKTMATTKRHPTIENHVVIYSGATILGGETVIGSNSVIGGNAWVTSSVPQNSTVFHTPTSTIKQRK